MIPLISCEPQRGVTPHAAMLRPQSQSKIKNRQQQKKKRRKTNKKAAKQIYATHFDILANRKNERMQTQSIISIFWKLILIFISCTINAMQQQ